MAITDWPAGERPRERLLSHGPEALSDAELLAIYLRVGVRGKSAVDLARDLLLRFDGNLNALAEATPAQLSSVSGIGIAKAVQLKASFELTRRALTQEMVKRDSFSSPGQVRDWLRLKLANRQHEVFMALWLDAQNRLLRADELFTGSLTQTSVYPRESGQDCPRPQCGSRHSGPQPSIGRRRAIESRRITHQKPQRRPCHGRCQTSRPLHRGRKSGPDFIRRTWTYLTIRKNSLKQTGFIR